MIRNSSEATAAKLKDLLLQKYSADLPFVNPTLTHKGKIISDTKLCRYCQILSNLEQIL
jgi:hypothetical protein